MGQKHVTTDGSGRPTGFYDAAVNTIPGGAQAATDAQYATLLNNPGTSTFIAGVLGTIAPPTPATPTLAVQATQALGAGIAITSTTHSGALNGIYAVDAVTMALAADLNTLIAANSGAFPGSVSTWSWPDTGGTLHVFPSAASFVSFYQALAAYRLALYAVIWSNSGSLPTAAATIP